MQQVGAHDASVRCRPARRRATRRVDEEHHAEAQQIVLWDAVRRDPQRITERREVWSDGGGDQLVAAHERANERARNDRVEPFKECTSAKARASRRSWRHPCPLDRASDPRRIGEPGESLAVGDLDLTHPLCERCCGGECVSDALSCCMVCAAGNDQWNTRRDEDRNVRHQAWRSDPIADQLLQPLRRSAAWH